MVCFVLLLGLMQQSFAVDFTPEYEKTLDTITKSIKTNGNKVILLNDGKLAFEKRLEIIDKANHHIHFLSLTLDANEYGYQFAEALKVKAREGVKVKIVLDETSITGNLFYGSFNTKRMELVKDLRANGVDVILYNPLGTFAKLWNNTHEKILLVDGKYAVAGGRNLGTKYFTYTTDVDAYFEGPIIAKMQDIFITKWKINITHDYKRWIKKAQRAIDRLVFRWGVKFGNKTRYHKPFMNRHHLRKMLKDEKSLNYYLTRKFRYDPSEGLYALSRFKKELPKVMAMVGWHQHVNRRKEVAEIQKHRPVAYYPATTAIDDTAVRVVHHMPKEKGGDTIKKLHISLIDNAKNSVMIQNAYFFPKKDIMQALERAINRGVHVQILTNSPESTDEGKIRKFMRYPYLKLLEFNRRRAAKKISIWELQTSDEQRRLLHGKSMVVDDNATIVGSYNLDPRSEDWSSEHVTLIYGTEHAQEQLAVYNHALDEKHYQPFTLQDLDQIRAKLLKQKEDESLYDYFVKLFI
jgi:phosphatidylserine/phosphatidylglycerophosphate/cardiolipin synthase-like enzyme